MRFEAALWISRHEVLKERKRPIKGENCIRVGTEQNIGSDARNGTGEPAFLFNCTAFRLNFWNGVLERLKVCRIRLGSVEALTDDGHSKNIADTTHILGHVQQIMSLSFMQQPLLPSLPSVKLGYTTLCS